MPMMCGGVFYVHQALVCAQSKAMGAPDTRQKCNTGPRHCQGIKTAEGVYSSPFPPTLS